MLAVDLPSRSLVLATGCVSFSVVWLLGDTLC